MFNLFVIRQLLGILDLDWSLITTAKTKTQAYPGTASHDDFENDLLINKYKYVDKYCASRQLFLQNKCRPGDETRFRVRIVITMPGFILQ